jgi:hypothetical protein
MSSDGIPADLPLVALALGDTPDALLASSTFPFELDRVHAIELVPVTRAVRFRCTRRPGGFDLPLAGLVAISFTAGLITSARVNPHLGNLTEEEATGVAFSVGPALVEAGYRPVAGLGKGAEALPYQLADRERSVDTTILVGKWTYGDDAVLLEVERSGAATVDRKPAPPRHLVRVRLENGPLTRRQIAQVSGAGRDVVWERARR